MPGFVSRSVTEGRSGGREGQAVPQPGRRPRRLPVALLSGFLGSGKTTLVNALLRDPRLADTAVAVNEFGDVPLDRDLIDHGTDSTVVMANGCLCCNLSGDMEEAVMRLFSRRDAGDVPRFKRLIVEPSGLADPAPIAQAILRNPLMARALRLEAIVTTVDALFAEAQLARHPETRKQVALADRLVLTKTDLADAAASSGCARRCARLNPVAPIVTRKPGRVDAAALFPPAFLDPHGEAKTTGALRPVRRDGVPDADRRPCRSRRGRVADRRPETALARSSRPGCAASAWAMPSSCCG